MLYSQYRELQAFAQFGSDLDADTKKRLALGERIVEVLKQDRNSPVDVGCQVSIIYAVTNGYLDTVPTAEVRAFEQELYEYMHTEHSALLQRLNDGAFSAQEEAELSAALSTLLSRRKDAKEV